MRTRVGEVREMRSGAKPEAFITDMVGTRPALNDKHSWARRVLLLDVDVDGPTPSEVRH